MSDPGPEPREFHERAPFGHLATDATWVITRANDTMARMVGRDEADLVGEPFMSLLSPGSRIYHETHVAPLVGLQGEVAEVSAEVVTSTGERLPVLLQATQAASDGPVHIGLMPAPARRRFEAELQAARRAADAAAARTRLLYEVIAALGGAVTPIEVAARFEQTFAEVSGGRAEVWLPWDADHLARATAGSGKAQERLPVDASSDIATVWHSGEGQGEGQGGGTAWVVPIKDAATVLGVVRVMATDMDVDLALSLATELSQSLRRARLFERKDWLLGMAAHDLRTPLTVVKGFAETIAHYSAERLTVQELTMVQQIIDGAGRMAALVDDVLEMASVESGLMMLDRAPIDLADLTTLSIAEHSVQATEKQISVTMDAAGDVTVLADGRRLRQVLDNLVSNAVKYGRLGSDVVVRLRGDADEVHVEVQDQGEGIRDSEIGMVFEAFRKTSTQTTGGETSTGLGLSIARSIVEAHGGAISVVSNPGTGSVFSVVLPRGVTDRATGQR